MASQLRPITLAAPGFFGLNTQESGITLASGFALEAKNCIIDKFGRIGARKGWTPLSGTSVSMTGQVRAIAEHVESSGNLRILFTADNKLWRLDGSDDPEEVLPQSGTAINITEDDWQIISYNNKALFVQQDHTMVYYDDTTGTYYELTAAPASTTPSCGAACFNRVWVADDYTVYWSKILEPTTFTGTGTGYINIREVFGEDDKVTAVTQYNNRLVIFGNRNIALFAGGEDPTGEGFRMVDHITGVGCIARDSVQSIGTEVVFLAADGVRALGRTIQETSAPMRDISKNVRDDIVSFATSEPKTRIKSIYSPNDAFYLLSFPSANLTYVFDVRAPLQDGSFRVTKWTNINPTAFALTRSNTLLLGQEGYVGQYGNYADNGTAYSLVYFTNYFDFDSPTTEKLLKKMRLAILGGVGQVALLKYAFDYGTDYEFRQFNLSSGETYEYNVDQYFSDDGDDNEAEYTSGQILDNISINVGGRGAVVQIGIESTINGGPLSIQKMDIFAKTGKLVT